MKAKHHYIGLMSGTSMDAIDAVLVKINAHSMQVIATHSETIPPSLKYELLELCAPGYNGINRLGKMDTRLGRLSVDAVCNLLNKTPFKKENIKAIGSHGQTIRHHPNEEDYPFSIQIADPNIIAAQTQITTVADFRRRDLAHHGQGAPLTPLFHKFLLQDFTDNQWIVNIGGIANVTLLKANGDVLGFDTGPGNILLDAWCDHCTGQPFDDQGMWGNSGTYHPALLHDLLDDPFFQQPTPKSTGREHFNLKWLEKKLTNYPDIKPEDVQATLIQLTSQSIADAIHAHQPLPSTLWIAGGGAHNTALINQLQIACSHYHIQNTDALGIPPDWIEACAFAWLAKQTLEKKKCPLQTITGACQDDILGAIYQT